VHTPPRHTEIAVFLCLVSCLNTVLLLSYSVSWLPVWNKHLLTYLLTLKSAQCRYRRASEIGQLAECTMLSLYTKHSSNNNNNNNSNHHSHLRPTRISQNMFKITSKTWETLLWSMIYPFPKFHENQATTYCIYS